MNGQWPCFGSLGGGEKIRSGGAAERACLELRPLVNWGVGLREGSHPASVAGTGRPRPCGVVAKPSMKLLAPKPAGGSLWCACWVTTGGWMEGHASTLLTCYQHSDERSMLRVMAEPKKLMSLGLG